MYKNLLLSTILFFSEKTDELMLVSVGQQPFGDIKVEKKKNHKEEV